MSRYLLIALAIVVGGLIGWWLSRRDKAGETTLVEEKKQLQIWPWIAGITVLILGLFILASHERADISSSYQPATITNGDIKPGQFDNDDN